MLASMIMQEDTGVLRDGIFEFAYGLGLPEQYFLLLLRQILVYGKEIIVQVIISQLSS